MTELIEAYNLPLYPHYGSREMALGGAVSCQARRGMHLRENHVIAEIIGPDGKRLADGERGELVITTVGMEAMPLIRYRTGDYTRILPEPCPCGSSLIRLDGPGRDSLAEKLDGAVFSAEGVADFAAELTGGTLRLRILAAGSVDVRSVLEKAKSAVNMPVAIEEIREYSDDGTMLCPGKRKIINI
jgi:phenylacetate-coenzyme A ligase PaaK-like adenylate-forming protein